MFKALIATIFLLNLSSAPLHNVMLVVGNEGIEVGSIKQGEYRKLETLPQDSIRVIFTLGQKREGWLGTEKMAYCVGDTIRIDDNTQTFELEIENFSR
jgi:hypothetical protein